MLVKPDFSETKDEVTAGTYKGTIVAGNLKDWPNGGSYVEWQIETFDSPDPKNNGRKIFHKTSISGPGAFTLQQLYKAAMGTEPGGEFDTEMLHGRKVIVDVVAGVNRKTGEPTGYTEVKKVRPLSAE